MSKQKADYIFYGGNIITMDDSQCPEPEALATEGTRIVAVGKRQEVFSFSGPETKHVELGSEQTLLPGLIEPHLHAIRAISFHYTAISCRAHEFNSYEGIEKIFKKTLEETDPDSGKWCMFYGWDPELIPSLPKLSADFLDTLSRDIPILVLGQNGHAYWVNHKAFELSGINNDTPNPPGGEFVRDEATNELTGQLLEAGAVLMILKHASFVSETKQQLDEAIDSQFREFARCGFTTVTDLAYFPDKSFDAALYEKSLLDTCPVRLALYQMVDGPGTKTQPEKQKQDVGSSQDEQAPQNQEENQEDLPIKEGNEKLWLAGVKIIADGSPHCGTAATRQPFLQNSFTKLLSFPSDASCGSLNFSDEMLSETVKYWHGRVKQIAIHAHGERCIEQVLDVYEKILDDVPTTDHRYRIEHVGLAEEPHIIRAAKLNLALSFFVAELYFYATTYSTHIIGEERTKRWCPLSLASKHGLRWTIHQDHPFFPGIPQPFANMKTAVTRTQRNDPSKVYGREYCVTIEEALKAYTIDAAWQIHKDEELGSLTVGKKADLAILTQNPLTKEPLKLEDIRVIDTFIDGRSNNLSEKIETKANGKIVITYPGYAESN